MSGTYLVKVQSLLGNEVYCCLASGPTLKKSKGSKTPHRYSPSWTNRKHRDTNNTHTTHTRTLPQESKSQFWEMLMSVKQPRIYFPGCVQQIQILYLNYAAVNEK